MKFLLVTQNDGCWWLIEQIQLEDKNLTLFKEIQFPKYVVKNLRNTATFVGILIRWISAGQMEIWPSGRNTHKCAQTHFHAHEN